MTSTVRPALLVDLAVKAILVGLLLLAVTRPDLPQFEGDTYAASRAIAYPITLLVVPAAWALLGRPRGLPFPYALDLLVPAPLIVDVAAPRLYHSVEWWDDVMHVASWGVLGAALVLLLSWFPFRHVALVAIALVAALCIAALWELFEYLVWVRTSPALLETAYADTRSDLICDVVASVVAVALTLRSKARFERAGRVRPTAAGSPETITRELVGWS